MKKKSPSHRHKNLTQIELLTEIGKKTGYFFQKIDFLENALTHPSACARVSGCPHYERLEFLGDRVLGFVIADMLFNLFPHAPEGEMSLRFNALVNAVILSKIAEAIDLPFFLRVGSEMGSLLGQKRVNLRADALEALIAAIYLDGGMSSASAFIHNFWKKHAETFNPRRRDAKTELQEWVHRKGLKAPVYEIHNRQGPDHDPCFTVGVYIEGFAVSLGEGATRRQAEQAAAQTFLIQEAIWLPNNNQKD